LIYLIIIVLSHINIINAKYFYLFIEPSLQGQALKISKLQENPRHICRSCWESAIGQNPFVLFLRISVFPPPVRQGSAEKTCYGIGGVALMVAMRASAMLECRWA
jgi:hypothetical protein